MVYVLFIIGFVFLIYGANFLVDGAASLAKKYNISNIVIGLTIVALGTSSPELVVNLIASFKGSEDVALGNIMGSNISNIFLILGVSALIFPLTVNNNTYRKEIPLALLAALVLGIAANDAIIDGHGLSFITRSDGLILIAFFLLFMHYAFSIARLTQPEDYQIKVYSVVKSWLMIVTGIAGLVLGGKWIVDGAVIIAASLGMSEALISLTIIAIGTSLPELATCVVAALKKNPDIVIGNVIGSNIFNVFFVLGISAVIKPLPFNPVLNFDVITGIIACALLLFFLLIPRRKVLERWQGGAFVLIYVVYIVLLVLRG
ncbi:MAG: sodium:calcium antiporter [Bacteroidetes bacterium]|nr:MAG: sodium:calcium antiporter [Bacteroidota bacterium]